MFLCCDILCCTIWFILYHILSCTIVISYYATLYHIDVHRTFCFIEFSHYTIVRYISYYGIPFHITLFDITPYAFQSYLYFEMYKMTLHDTILHGNFMYRIISDDFSVYHSAGQSFVVCYYILYDVTFVSRYS